MTDNAVSTGKQPGVFLGHKKTLLALGIATVLIIVGGAAAASSTSQEATFWSSAVGTAAGGMVAVWAAFFFWASDEKQARIRRNVDEAAARDQRIEDEHQRRQRAIDDRSKEVALQILAKAVSVKPLARNTRTSQSDGEIEDRCDWMKAHAALVSDPALRQDLEDAINMLDPSRQIERYTSVPYTERVYPVVSWIRDLVQNYASEGQKEVDRPQHYEEIKAAYEQYAEHQEEQLAFYEADKETRIRESQQRQANDAAYEEAFGGGPA